MAGRSLPHDPAGPDLDPERLRALAEAVTRLRRSLRRAIRPDYPWETLPMAQVEVLQLLDERPGIAVGEVAVSLRLASNTVSTLVGQLFRDGLVVKKNDEKDRRIGRLTLSDEGRERLGYWQLAHERLLGDALLSLSSDQRDSLLSAVEAIDELGLALHADGVETATPASL